MGRAGANSRPRLKIAILLPTSPDLRTVRRSAELSAAIVSADTAAGHSIEVTVGVPESNERKWRFAEQQIRRRVPDVIVRHVEWTRVTVKNARRMFAGLSEALDLEGIKEVSVPRDWGWNFQDCDLWISLAGPGVGAILPLRPTTHYCADLAQRYVPTAITGTIHDPYWLLETDAFRIWRQGLVIASDDGTAADLVSYAGVRRERIEVVPDLLNQLPSIPPEREDDRDRLQLLWLLRGNALDDLENSVQALATYYREGGQMDVLLAHDASTPVDHHIGAAALAPDLLKFYHDLPRFAYRSLDELERMLPKVGAVWSSQSAGGEAEHVHDAARAGLTLLAPKLALNEQTVERLGAAALLYPLEDPLALADRLRDLEASLAEDAELKSPTAKSVSQETRIDWGFAIDRMVEHAHAG